MSSDVFVIVNILNTTTSLSFLCLYSNHYSFLSFSLLLWNIVYTLKKKKTILTLLTYSGQSLNPCSFCFFAQVGLVQMRLGNFSNTFIPSFTPWILVEPSSMKILCSVLGITRTTAWCLTLELACWRQKQEEMIPVPYQAMSAVREEAWDTAEQHLSWLWREESGKPLREERTE